MRGKSQRTLIAVVREGIHRWRLRENLTKRRVADKIVEFHVSNGYANLTGIHFSALTGNERQIERAIQTNSERIWRWLDDETKDSFLLPLNLLPMVLAAIPIDIRIEVVAEILGPLGLVVTPAGQTQKPTQMLDVLIALVKEAGEASTAFARLCGGQSSSASALPELIDTDRELAEGIAAMQQARDKVQDRLRVLRDPAPAKRVTT